MAAPRPHGKADLFEENDLINDPRINEMRARLAELKAAAPLIKTQLQN